MADLFKRRKMALVLQASDLRALDSAIRAWVPKADLSITHPDGIKVDLSGIDALLGAPNAKQDAIRSVAWNGTSQDPNYGKLELESDGFRNIAISMRGKDVDAMRKAVGAVESALTEARPLYWPFAQFNAFFAVSTLYAVVSLFFWSVLPTPTPEEIRRHFTARAIGFFLPIVVAGLAGGMQWWLFPLVEFRIGYGERRYQTRFWWRVVVFLGLIIGTVGSILASTITGSPSGK